MGRNERADKRCRDGVCAHKGNVGQGAGFGVAVVVGAGRPPRQAGTSHFAKSLVDWDELGETMRGSDMIETTYSKLFESTGGFLLFDYFRIPYDRVVDAPGRDRGESLRRYEAVESVADPSRGIYWPRFGEGRRNGEMAGAFEFATMTIAGHVAIDVHVESILAELGGTWFPAETIRDRGGATVSSVWRAGRNAYSFRSTRTRQSRGA